MRQKSKQAPRADRTYDSLKDILEEEEFNKSIEERERNLQSRKTEQYFDQLLLSRLQDGDPFLRKLTRMSTEGLEDEYYDLTKRLPEPEIESTTKHFDSGVIKGKRTVRVFKQPKEYYMINMIRAELRRRKSSIADPAASGVKEGTIIQAPTKLQRGDVNDPASVELPEDRMDIMSQRSSQPTQADYDNLKAENLIMTRALVRLRKSNKAETFTEAQLRDLIESNRKKNGKINYSKISKIMGVHHTTAKRRLNSRGIR